MFRREQRVMEIESCHLVTRGLPRKPLDRALLLWASVFGEKREVEP